MRKMILLAAVVAAAIAVPATHTASAAPAAKVSVCHMNSSNTSATIERAYGYSNDWSDPYDYRDYSYGYSYSYTYAFGNVIEVSENAVGAHVGHGDSTSYFMLSDAQADNFESWEYGYDYGFSRTYDYGSYTYTYTRVNRYQRTNGEVNNADCYTRTYEYTSGFPE